MPADLAGARADRVLASVAGISRRLARTLCDEGAVTVDGAVIAAADRVAGMEISAPIPDEDDTLLPDPAVAFVVRYEDDDLLVVDKPAGVVVHPGAGTKASTLASGLVARYPGQAALADDARWGIVHRLDKDTSGVLLVARSRPVLAELQAQLKRRLIARVYLALVDGTFDHATGTIEAPVGPHPSNPTKRAVVHGGKPARTHYRRVAGWKDASLLEVRLDTGRTHQIRVHLAAIGHPVSGDPGYGRRGEPGRRMFLHACELSFHHPVSGIDLTVRSPLPPDLVARIEDLGPPSSGAVPV